MFIMRLLNKGLASYLAYKSTKEVVSVFVSQRSLQVQKHRNFGFRFTAVLHIGCGCCSVIKSCPTVCHPVDCSTPSFPSLLPGVCPNSMSTESMIPSNHLILCCPFLLLPSVFPSTKDFSSESACCIGRPKYWSFSFSIRLCSEYSELTSFRIDWFDLAVQGTFKSLFQHHNSKASIFWHSAFSMGQLSHLYVTIGTTITLTMDLCWQKDISVF